MDEMIDEADIQNVCRLCLSNENPKTWIFNNQGSTIPLASKIQACLSINVTIDDKLSTVICLSCIKHVNQWHEYRESCHQSQIKLTQWLSKQVEEHVAVKCEPDNDLILGNAGNFEASLTEIDEVHDVSLPDKEVSFITIKDEPTNEYDTDCTIEIESVTGNELTSTFEDETNDIFMEADSTQKAATKNQCAKKKSRRRVHTHYKGPKLCLLKCKICNINLHSKYSYINHMNRYHSEPVEDVGTNESEMSTATEEEEEEIEDVEDELVSMENDALLPQVQQNIISQLKTFSCYTCKKSFNDHKRTLVHIRYHMPDLRPYTCTACLTEFPDRSMYKLHCCDSFECAMKIALVVPTFGKEKYFTCNMCLRSLPNRKELLSHLSKHSYQQYQALMSASEETPKLRLMESSALQQNNVNSLEVSQTSVKNNDPGGYTCKLCGMKYKRISNWIKHSVLCMKLKPSTRISYECTKCSKTFLVFRKFCYHLASVHKTKEIVCSKCHKKFKNGNEFLQHYGEHTTIEGSREFVDTLDGTDTTEFNDPLIENPESEVERTYNCALCDSDFSSMAELSEHRNLHLKVKIYSCVICRSMFSSANALEIHMKDHGIKNIQDLNTRASSAQSISPNKGPKVKSLHAKHDRLKCHVCGRRFSNAANKMRHVRYIHEKERRLVCPLCPEMFHTKEKCETHVFTEHPDLADSSFQCNECWRFFVCQDNLDDHMAKDHPTFMLLKCDLCPKKFADKKSLKIHRGWHSRANYKLALDNPDNLVESAKSNDKRPATARKSFSSLATQALGNNLQCQVCNERFDDVTVLRKHLWDVHCAKNKAEKRISSNELQCELCTNVLPDQKSFESHLQWHKANPLFGNDAKDRFACDVCNKTFVSKKSMSRHKKLHKPASSVDVQYPQWFCFSCEKSFTAKQSLQRHNTNFHNNKHRKKVVQPANNPRQYSTNETNTKRLKMETNGAPVIADSDNRGKKAVSCHFCKKLFPNMSLLFRHKQLAHKYIHPNKLNKVIYLPEPDPSGKMFCTYCRRSFQSLSHLRMHYAQKHKNVVLQKSIEHKKCKKSPEFQVDTIIYSCELCDRITLSKDTFVEHMQQVHKSRYVFGSGKILHKEVLFEHYQVSSNGTICPKCNIKYPNLRCLKIHYIKKHANADLSLPRLDRPII
ncbi:gastrula zinc finger protein xFG20-1-like isoform X1 [Prorops nasuta]|uniref:gastrula zinc finger protein xFG20-1-like isoform X1 n=1 Tax=Prorops nasuta TaxID=863751 RepID=UPI0034CFA607